MSDHLQERYNLAAEEARRAIHAMRPAVETDDPYRVKAAAVAAIEAVEARDQLRAQLEAAGRGS